MAVLGEETQITCRFTTKLPKEYRVPPSTVAVPSQLTRYGLSQIVNHLLALEPSRPFDFLVKGELVRQKLEQFLLANEISAETVLEIEYIFAVEPAKPEQKHPHNDWVSGVAAQPGCILSGSYDGTVKTWHGAKLSSTATLHRGPVTALAALPRAQGALALSGGQDAVLLLSSVPALSASAADDGASAAARPLVAYREHTDAITSIAVSPEGTLFASASWDSSLRIWPTGSAVAERAADDSAAAKHEAGAKKAKKGAAGAAAPTAPVVEAAKQELGGHSQSVSSVAWPAAETIVSGSWDNTVRRWDAEMCTCTERHDGATAVYSVAAAPAGSQLVAFGGAERALHIWDPRTPTGKETDQKLCSSHTDWISSIAWHPASEHHVVSASYDTTLKLWDTRASIPLHTLEGHTEKVLCVAWSGPNAIVSGGADCLLQKYTVAL